VYSPIIFFVNLFSRGINEEFRNNKLEESVEYSLGKILGEKRLSIAI